MGVAHSPLRDRVIFVQGAPRSGTTWLVNLLAAHPQIAGVEAESHLFEFGVDRLFDNFEGRNPHLRGLNSYLESREQLVDLAREVCDGVLLAMRAHVSAGEEAEFVVEKTPSMADEASLDLLRKRECFPDAWYLHIVRDGEAVTRSLMGAPWMPDRSRANCERVWRQAVDSTRRTLADHPRYREMSYEELRADPVGQSADLFQWFGVDAGEEVLETVRRLSRERFSDRGVVRFEGGSSNRAIAGRRVRLALKDARKGLARARRLAFRDGGPAEGSGLAFSLARALRARDEAMLKSLTVEPLALIYRSPDGDLSLSGDAARAELLEIARQLFTRRHVNEWWASAGGGTSDWWTTVPGTPLWTLLFSGLGGDATRVDVAFGLFMRDDRITRVVVISAGSLAGRPLRELEPGSPAQAPG